MDYLVEFFGEQI